MSFEPLPSELDEARIAAEQPAVRGQLVRRLERLYAWCENEMASGDRPDPRFAELAVRITDRLAKLYRLDARVVVPPDVDDEQVQAQARKQLRLVVSAQVEELTKRVS